MNEEYYHWWKWNKELVQEEKPKSSRLENALPMLPLGNVPGGIEMHHIGNVEIYVVEEGYLGVYDLDPSFFATSQNLTDTLRALADLLDDTWANG